MEILLLSILSALFVLSSQAQAVFTSDYTALTVPQQYVGEIFYINDSLKQEIADIAKVRNDVNLLRSFPNIVSNVTVYQVSKDGDF